MDDLRVKLEPVVAPLEISHYRVGRVARASVGGETRWHRVEPVAVAHPDFELARQTLEQRRRMLALNQRGAELPLDPRTHLAAELVCHQLHAVTNAEHGET